MLCDNCTLLPARQVLSKEANEWFTFIVVDNFAFSSITDYLLL